MSGYLLIESQDPFEGAGVPGFLGLAQDLAGAGERVTLFLVQNGVLPARRCPAGAGLARAAAAGVEVLADDFSLRERGIAAAELALEVRPAPLAAVLEAMVAGRKCLWH